ncbi:all trans-polyprenyl-diphosphate synthase PDSS1 isoform X2 [Peromyscus maniculatus bairdii]|uniref:all trans-polyprenyl-diphosphate synthase PDSS1 isoform X2 n=1 Tax=Peromyscus maniculatus bairdii TaxID=230844 RepID=UPI003FD077D1
MATRWWCGWCWRRGCSWRPAAGSPRPERPGCAGPLGTRAASDTRAQMPYFSLVKTLTPAFPNVHSISQFHQRTPAVCCCSQIQSGEKYADPFKLGWRDLKGLYEDIRKELCISTKELKDMSEYYFDGKGKAFRPIIVVLMARACNIHYNNSRDMQASQRSIALIAEMIHTASLVHDDVIDDASSRRGKHTVNKVWGEKKAVLAGDLILSTASLALARIGNTAIISLFSQVIEDLVRGEFLQLGSKENENERFAHYLEKTFKKTASLIANSCKAVSVLGCPDPVVHEIAYQYGKNVGIAFQLIDDVLDFTSCSHQMGKPTSADLKLGLATGPVLFACQQSDGVQQTTYLAQQYCREAVREIRKLRPSTERDALIQLSESVLTRDK